MTQNEKIMRHLKAYGSITSLEAFRDYGCTRLSARIWDLRNKYGLDITDERKAVKNRFGETVHVNVYSLEGKV